MEPMPLKVELIAHTPNPEQVVAAAAKLCYSAVGVDQLMADLTPEKSAKFLNMLSTMGHQSPIEHASFTFAIEGVSRSLLAQITRHRLASFSVQSQRYVRLDDFQFVIPPEVEADPESKERFLTAMREEADHYLSLAQSLQEKHYRDFLSQGMDEKTARNKAEKKANEDARFVLPNACETKMVMTMNARSLYNFFAIRCCNRAQWEIRALAKEMYALVYAVAPTLFASAGPSCVASGKCPEGKMTCGQMKAVQAEYAALKEELSHKG
jgi:thymidylate synthase (FAD)